MSLPLVLYCLSVLVVRKCNRCRPFWQLMTAMVLHFNASVELLYDILYRYRPVNADVCYIVAVEALNHVHNYVTISSCDLFINKLSE